MCYEKESGESRCIFRLDKAIVSAANQSGVETKHRKRNSPIFKISRAR